MDRHLDLEYCIMKKGGRSLRVSCGMKRRMVGGVCIVMMWSLSSIVVASMTTRNGDMV